MIGKALALAAALALAVPATAPALTPKTARAAFRLAAEQSFSGFSETTPRITATCKMDRRFHARCHGRYIGDRLDTKITGSVTEVVEGYLVRFGKMTP